MRVISYNSQQFVINDWRNVKLSNEKKNNKSQKQSALP